MKGCIQFCLLLIVSCSTCAQNARLSGAVYRDRVPLLIRSDIFVKSSTRHGEFIVISERVKVGIAKKKDYLLEDVIIEEIPRKSKNYDSLHLQKMEYRICFPGFKYSKWKTIDQKKLLLDTFLSPKDTIVIDFRPIGHLRILQETKIIRAAWLPVVSAIRTRDVSDTFNYRISAKSVFASAHFPEGFIFVKDSVMTIPPGKKLELAISRHNLNKDSCIEYAIIDPEKSANEFWIKCGHLIILSGLQSRKNYIIKTRFEGQNINQTYRLQVGSYLWQQTWALLCMGLSGILLIGLIWQLIYTGRKKKKEREVEKGIDKCIKEQSKLDTHLVDNIFHSAMRLIRNNQNILAEQYLGNASGFLRDKLINAEKILVPFKNDLKNLEKFIANEQIKIGFDFSISVDPELDIGKIMLPPLLWQPSLENSIKHGISSSDQGRIAIKIHKRNNDLVFRICDNGKFNQKPVSSAKGFGIPITRERIVGLNMAYRAQNILYEVEQIDNETVVSFIFKNWLI